MRFRVRSLTTGKKYKCDRGEEIFLRNDGKVISQYADSLPYDLEMEGGYVVEFSFSKDAKGKNIWSDCVVND